MAIQTRPGDRVIWRSELRRALGVSEDTIRRWLKADKLPRPDVHLSQRSLGWKVSTLQAAGINLF